MTTMTARFTWFERTVPAKLSRSSFLMWFLLVLSSVLLTGAYIQERTTISTLASQAVPSMQSAADLSADFSLMQSRMAHQVSANADNRAQSRLDYNRARDAASSDVDTATRISRDNTLPSLGYSDTGLAIVQGQLRAAFYLYQQDLNEALAAHDRGDASALETSMKAASTDLHESLLPAARKFYESGVFGFRYEVGTSAARNNTLLHAGYVLAALVLALTVWQYLFMFMNCKIVVQATIVTLLLSVLAFGYSYQGLVGVDTHINRAMSVSYPGLTPPAVTPVKAAAVLEDEEAGALFKSAQLADKSAGAFSAGTRPSRETHPVSAWCVLRLHAGWTVLQARGQPRAQRLSLKAVRPHV